MRGPREKITPEQLATIAVPTLIAVGSNDVIAGSGAELASLIARMPNFWTFRVATICGRSEMPPSGRACSTF